MGKQLYIIDAKHNHVPKKYGHIMSATLPIFNVSGRVSCMSFFLSLITDLKPIICVYLQCLPEDGGEIESISADKNVIK